MNADVQTIREQVVELAAQGNHAGVVALAHHALRRYLELDDRTFFRLAYAEHKAALNPYWCQQVVTTLQDVLDDLVGHKEPMLEAKVIAGLTASVQLENLSYFEELTDRFRRLHGECPETDRWGGIILYNVGSAYAYHRNMSKAEELYREAAACNHAMYSATGDERYQFAYAIAQHNLSRVLLRDGRLDAANEAYLAGRVYLGEFPAKCLTREAELALAGGNSEVAAALLDEAERCTAVDPSTRVDIALVRARLDQVTGKLHDAKAFALEALSGALALARVEAEAEIVEFLDQL